MSSFVVIRRRLSSFGGTDVVIFQPDVVMTSS
jgi:hypothetical protein